MGERGFRTWRKWLCGVLSVLLAVTLSWASPCGSGFELAFEGQRKYDLLRWGILAETLQLFQSKMDKSLKGKYVAGDNFVKGKHELFPIPLGELQANPALNNQNNPGYE